jgi:hypothetical protein
MVNGESKKYSQMSELALSFVQSMPNFLAQLQGSELFTPLSINLGSKAEVVVTSSSSKVTNTSAKGTLTSAPSSSPTVAPTGISPACMESITSASKTITLDGCPASLLDQIKNVQTGSNATLNIVSSISAIIPEICEPRCRDSIKKVTSIFGSDACKTETLGSFQGQSVTFADLTILPDLGLAFMCAKNAEGGFCVTDQVKLLPTKNGTLSLPSDPKVVCTDCFKTQMNDVLNVPGQSLVVSTVTNGARDLFNGVCPNLKVDASANLSQASSAPSTSIASLAVCLGIFGFLFL